MSTQHEKITANPLLTKTVYTVSEVAKILAISKSTAYEAVRRQQIPHIKICNSIRVPAFALENWLRAEGRWPAGSQKNAQYISNTSGGNNVD